MDLNNIRIACVIIPPDQQGEARDLYVKNCIRRGRVSLLFEDGSVAHDSYVSKQCIRDIVFPAKFGEAGSTVLATVGMKRRHPLVFSVFNKEDEFNEFEEGSNSIKSEGNGNFTEVITTKEGKINISANSDYTSGEININVSNKNATGKLNIKVKGECDVYSSGKINVQSESEINAEVLNVDKSTVLSMKIDQDFITFNNNRLESFIADLNKLVSRMNENEDRLKNHQHGYIPYPGGSPATPVSTTKATSLIPPDNTLSFTNTTVDDVKDEKIKN